MLGGLGTLAISRQTTVNQANATVNTSTQTDPKASMKRSYGPMTPNGKHPYEMLGWNAMMRSSTRLEP